MNNHTTLPPSGTLRTILLAVALSGATLLAAQETTGIFTYNAGNAEVSLLPEVQQRGNTSILIGATPEMLEKYAPDGTFPNAVNAFLVRMSGKNILVDAGFGTNLYNNLQQLGVSPEQVDIVLLTHAHGDHIGGLLRNGSAAFPQAILYVAQAEYDYWSSDKAMNGTPANRHSGFENARKVFAAYKSRLHLFQPEEIGHEGEALITGVSGIAAYGHTPGHTAYMVGTGDERLLIWGDLTHAMAVQMPYPEVAVTYDVNPVEAAATREKILKYASDNAIHVAGMHIAYPSIGKILPDGNGYFFEKCVDKAAVERAVQKQMQTCPASRLQDIYKNFFQDYFGPEHLIKDTAAAADYLQRELASFSDCSGAEAEPAGWEGNFYRVNLCVLKENKIPYQQFLNAFIESANATVAPPLAAWVDTWNEILTVIDAMRLSLPVYEADKAMLNEILQSGRYAVHHSEEYNKQYSPHYRIIKKEILDKLTIHNP
jgi:glyoxylase-like metal-dependent hydrolase (beta-lactamase superfamily II)